MATRFELVLAGDDPVRLRAAGEEALSEIDRLDGQLSCFRPESEISWINTHAASEPVKVEPQLFRLLQLAKELSLKTDGAFDVTIRPLMRAWRFTDGASGCVPDITTVNARSECIGMHHVHLDADSTTITFDKMGVELDLGAIGKGYAIERAVESLRENGITSGLIQGGTSSINAIGSPPESSVWRVLVAGHGEVIDLCDSAMSVSAKHGRSFDVDGLTYGHIINPRTGEPVQNTVLAAIIGPSPTLTDALSTAMMVLGDTWLGRVLQTFPGYQGIVVPALGPARAVDRSQEAVSSIHARL